MICLESTSALGGDCETSWFWLARGSQRDIMFCLDL